MNIKALRRNPKFARIFKIFLATVFITLSPFYFYSYPPTITFDTGHYLGYIDVISGKEGWDKWDIVRGPIFPYLLYSLQTVFPFNLTAINVLLSINYLIYILLILYISKRYLHSHLSRAILIAVTTLNPIIIGYLKTYLTEFIAIVVCLALFVVFDKFINNTKLSKRENIMYPVLMSASWPFLWFLKQPYAVYVLGLFVTSSIVIIFSKKFRRLKLLISANFLGIVFVILLVTLWYNFLPNYGNAGNSNRRAESMLSTMVVNSIKDPWRIVESYLRITNLVYFSQSDYKPANILLFNFTRADENNNIGLKYLMVGEVNEGAYGGVITNVIGGSSSVPSPEIVSRLEVNRSNISLRISKYLRKLARAYHAWFTTIMLFLPPSAVYLLYRWIRSASYDDALPDNFLFLTSISSSIFMSFFIITLTSIDRYLIPIYTQTSLFYICAFDKFLLPRHSHALQPDKHNSYSVRKKTRGNQ